MQKSSFVILAFAVVLTLSFGFAAYAAGAFDEISHFTDSLTDIDGCSAVISDEPEEKISFREELDKCFVEYREDTKPFDISDPATWYVEAKAGGLSDETAALAKIGMSLEEAVTALGKPQRDVASGGVILEWDMKSGESLLLGFKRSYAGGNDNDWKCDMVEICLLDECGKIINCRKLVFDE